MKSLLLCLALLLAGPVAGDQHVNHTVLKKLGWQFAFPTDGLGPMSILEAAKIAKTLTVHHLEVIVGQPLSAEDQTLLDSRLDDAKVISFVQDLKAAGLDVASVRTDASLNVGELTGLFRVAKGLGAKVTVLPASSTDLFTAANADLVEVARAAKLKVAFIDTARGLSTDHHQVGVAALANNDKSFGEPITEARMVADQTADRKLCETLLKQQFKGTVTVQPEHKTLADTLAAMDAFAATIHELPTTQP